MQVGQPEFISAVDDFQFVNNKWVEKQIRRSKRGTASGSIINGAGIVRKCVGILSVMILFYILFLNIGFYL